MLSYDVNFNSIADNKRGVGILITLQAKYPKNTAYK